MKVFVVMIEGKPYAFTTRAVLERAVKDLGLTTIPEVHEVEVIKRPYGGKKAAWE